MKYLLLIFLLLPTLGFSQINFMGYDIDFTQRNPLLTQTDPEGGFFYTESDTCFKRVVQINETYGFLIDSPSVHEYQTVYSELVRLFGTETKNEDVIPDKYKNDLSDEALVRLSNTNNAILKRYWELPDMKVMFVYKKQFELIFIKNY